MDAIVADAREEFARGLRRPAIRANALYGGGYPLFTALGRPLIAKLAVEHARATGCDTIAHGCTGKGNDQVRLEATIAALAPELRGDRPRPRMAMGREEEIAYASEHGIPVKGGTEAAAVLDRRQPLGPLVRRASEIETLDEAAGRRGLPARHPSARRAGRAAAGHASASSAGVPVSLDGERLGLVDLIERAAEIGCRHGVGHRRPHRGPDRRPQGPRPLRGPGGGDPAHRAPGPREARLDDPPERAQARARPQVGLPRLRGALARPAPPRPRRLHGLGERAGDRRDHASSSTRGRSAWSSAARPYALYDESLASFGESGGEFSQAASPGFIELSHAAEPDGAPDWRAPQGEERAR